MLEILLSGRLALPPVEPSGGYAFFVGGLQSGSVRSDYTDKYTYADNTIVPGTALLATRYRGAMCGNAVVAIYGGGTQTGTVATTEKYTFGTQSFAVGTVLPAGRAYLRAASNMTQGLFVGGVGSTRADMYFYADDTTGTGQAMTAVRYNGAAAGNAEVAVFAQGHNGSVTLATSVVYTHATVTRVNGTTLSQQTQGSLGVGDASHALFGAGNSGLTTLESYAYASNIVAAASSISSSIYTGAAAGDKTVGILAGGGNFTSNTFKCTYAGDTRTAGSQLGQLRTELSAASSGIHF